MIVLMIASGSALAEEGGESEGEREKEPAWTKLSKLPSDAEVDRWIRNASQARERKDWVNFASICQQILESDRESFLVSSQQSKTSARQQVIEWISALPPDARRIYENQVDGKAQSLFRKAKSEGDMGLIAQVARVYPLTHAGRRAASYLGASLLENGMSGLAATTLLELSGRKNLPENQMPSVLAQLLVAARQSGAESLVSMTRQRLDKLPAVDSLKLGKETVRPQDFYQRFVQNWGEIPPAENKGYSSFPGSSFSERELHGMPYLVPLWSVPIFRQKEFDSEKWRQVTAARPRYTRQLIPSLYPVSVSGKVILKTFDGIMALDGRSGRQLWRASAADRRLGEFIGRLLSFESKDQRLQAQAIANAYQAALSHAFEDTVQFTLAVGGGRVYSVDTVYPGEEAFEARRVPGPAPWVNQQIRMKNSLRAFELNGGKLLWEINGVVRASDEATTAEEGMFLGAPVFAEDSLLVLVDRLSAVYLLFLDPATGKKRGEIPLCMTSKPARSFHYRIKDACPITVVGGIAYCSTQVGRFFAIDLVSRRVIWRFEYEHSLTDLKIGNRNYYASGTVRRQPVSAPAVWGGRLLFIPSDSPDAFCLDRITGSKIWEVPIRPGSFLAGIRRGRAIIAGRRIIALDMVDGKQVWERVAGEPTGRGWLGADAYLAPMADQRLVQVNLETGTIESQIELSLFDSIITTGPAISELGNIVVTPHNILISGPLGVTAVPSAREELTRIQHEIRTKGRDRQSMLRQVVANLSAGNPLPAIENLKTLLAESEEPTNRDLCRSLLLRVLLTRAIITEADSAKHLKAAGALTKSDDDKAALFDAMRRVHQREGRLLPAFEAARQFAAVMAGRPVREEETPGLYVRADRWLAGWLLDRWNEASDKERTALAAEVTELLSEMPETKEALRRFLNAFGEIPPTGPAWLDLAARLAEGDAWPEAEMICLRLANSSDSTIAVEATWLRAQICERSGFVEDASWISRNLLKRLGDSKVPAIQKVRSRVSEFVKKRPESLRPQGMPTEVPERIEFKKETSKRRYSYPRPFDLLSTELPSQREYSIQRGYGSSILFERGDDEWTLTHERSRMSYEPGRVSFNGYSARHVYPLGHLYFLAEQNSLFCASPAQKKVKWSFGAKNDWQTWFSSEFQDSAGVRPYTQDRGVAVTFVGGTHYYRHTGLIHVDPRCLVLNDANTLLALDPMTGELLWTRFLEMPNYSAMTFNHDSLYEHHRRSQLKSYRLLDGKFTGQRPLIDFINYKGMYTRAGYLGANIDDKTLTVRGVDPLTGKDIWSHPTPTGCSFLHPTPGEFGMLYPSGDVHFISLTDGAETFRGKFAVAEKPWASASAWSRDSNVYLLLGGASQNRETARQIHFNQPVRFEVKGALHCFDRKTGKHRWQRDLTKPEGRWYLWNTSRASSPFLFFVRDVRKEVEQNGRKSQRVVGYHLLILSALTGKVLLDRELANNERPLFIRESEGTVQIHVPGGYLVATYGK